MASAEVPKFTVVLRKAYAAGFYAMCAPGFEPRATLALPTASIGPMAPEASANAMYANKIAEIADPAERAAFTDARLAEQPADFNLLRLASELIIDAIVEPASCAPSSSRGWPPRGLDPRPAPPAPSPSQPPGLGGCPWQTISASCWPPRCSRCASSGARLPRPSCSRTARARHADSPDAYWAWVAERQRWMRPWDTVRTGELGDFTYFAGGQINVADNCVDRWAQDPATAGPRRRDLGGRAGRRPHRQLRRARRRGQPAGRRAARLGVTKGDVVAIYMPNAVEAFTAVHACNRIGAIYTILFSGFGPDAVLSRLEAARPRS